MEMLGNTQLYYFQPYTEKGEEALKNFIKTHPGCKATIFYAPQSMYSFLAPCQLTIQFEVKKENNND